MLVSDLIKTSLRKIGALSSGEVVDATRQAEALSTLQTMLRSWGALSINIFATVQEDIPLISGKYIYTWGSEGDINTTRPNQIVGAYILDNLNITHPVDVVSEGKYNSIRVKETTSRPHSLFYHPIYPLANLYLYPVPNLSETLHVTSFKPFVETSSFGLAADTLAFPAYYEEPIIYNLAIRLAPEYGRAVSSEVALVAKTSYDTLVTLNAANQVEPVYISVPAKSPYGVRYSINFG